MAAVVHGPQIVDEYFRVRTCRGRLQSHEVGHVPYEVDAAIQNVLDTTAFINGPDVRLFAEELSQYLGVKHVIPCANGRRPETRHSDRRSHPGCPPPEAREREL